VLDAEAALGPRMKDARRWKIVIAKAHHALPRYRRALATPHEGTLPKPGHPISEKNERPIVRRYRMIGIEASDYLHEPLPLNGYRLMPSAL
jgi:hypothetical protein